MPTRYTTQLKREWKIGTLLTNHSLLTEKAALNVQNTEHQTNV
jgi:hypothetical protein